MSIERMFFLIDGLRRRWFLLLLPLVLALPVAILVWKSAPKKYEAQSTILMLSANRASEGSTGTSIFPRQSALEQVAVLEAWLKSEPVLLELLPLLSDSSAAPTAQPEDLSAEVAILRRSITLQLVGAAALEIRLEGGTAKGLGRKLEIIVTRLLEGLVNPESGILNAGQMIVARRSEAVTEANDALTHAIEAAGLDPTIERPKLQMLYNLKAQRQTSGLSRPGEHDGLAGRSSLAQPVAAEHDSTVRSKRLDEIRATITTDAKTIATLEWLFDRYEAERTAYEIARQRSSASANSYVRVFDAPERLTVIGRPRDPLSGTSAGRKHAIAVMLVASFCGLAWAMLMVLLDSRLRVSEDFEAIAGVPVLARLPRTRSRR